MTDVRYVHQHFDRPAKFGWFTPSEWLLCAVGAVVTALWWRYVSPFGFSGTATVAILLNTPLYFSARLADGRAGRIVRVRLRVSAAAWMRPHRGRGGCCRRARGYAVAPGTVETQERAIAVYAREAPDFDGLWR